MTHWICIRSAYGSSWDIAANRRRLALTEGITIRSLRSQTSRDFRVLVLLHQDDALLVERSRAFSQIGADFLYLDASGTSSEVAYAGYRAGWRDVIGDGKVAMTRLDDDDAFAPWAVARVQEAAAHASSRAALMFPLGVRVWRGGYTIVRHMTNAMHTLVTPPGDFTSVYDYGHRVVRRYAPVRVIDSHPAWLWSRHDDTISGWRTADRPLTPDIRAMFDVDWSLFGEWSPRKRQGGNVFR